MESAAAVARHINAGGVSVNDAGMTTMIFKTEKSAFGYSGMGPSRVGPSGLTRFLRQKSLYLNRGAVLPVSIFQRAPNRLKESSGRAQIEFLGRQSSASVLPSLIREIP